MKNDLAVLEFDSPALDLDSALSRVGVGSAGGARILLPERLTSRSSASTVREEILFPWFLFFSPPNKHSSRDKWCPIKLAYQNQWGQGWVIILVVFFFLLLLAYSAVDDFYAPHCYLNGEIGC